MKQAQRLSHLGFWTSWAVGRPLYNNNITKWKPPTKILGLPPNRAANLSLPAASASASKRDGQEALVGRRGGRRPDALSASSKAADDLLAAFDCGGVHGHSLFFDALVQLIPPRFYLSAADEDRPWYQGLSKGAKAAMKAQSHANVKAARLDPTAPPASTLDLLKKSLRERLHRRIAELRGNRCTRPEFLNKPKREKGKKGKKGRDAGKKRKGEDGGA
ncbi:hypothetical protein E2562_016299 [Oryza meyeriana var. granulata]|uniref:Ribosomal RNA-processing protein 14 N-terminal domain-containing protein n=1 Tax=Oryza meyeriana var. granulata TaxID=110450 RepID=A0A6G1CQS5_9ORYZ|nr:hypothetical protein E2562_016299 [Oryza meyeriana var. granulata]